MEKTLFITRLEDLSFWGEEYRRIYFGSEFCERRIPSIEEVKKVINFCKQRNVAFSLVTPYVTNKGLENLVPLWKEVEKIQEEKEVVVNDWGVIHFLSKQYPDFSLCLGRLLNKQKRGPRAHSFLEEWDSEVKDYFAKARGENIFNSNLARKINLKRIELDNLLQGIKREDANIPASLYYPFVYVSTSRYCLTGISFSQERYKRKVNFSCKQECKDTTFSFTSKNMPVIIYLKGNTQFFKNEEMLSHPSSLGIDRLVYQPKIPI